MDPAEGNLGLVSLKSRADFCIAGWCIGFCVVVPEGVRGFGVNKEYLITAMITQL